MAHPVVKVPELKVLKEQLKDPKWVKYYDDASGLSGSSDSMYYLLTFLKKA